jgi:hypothetical protein
MIQAMTSCRLGTRETCVKGAPRPPTLGGAIGVAKRFRLPHDHGNRLKAAAHAPSITPGISGLPGPLVAR